MYLLQTCNKIVFANKPLNVNTGIYKKKKKLDKLYLKK